MRELYLGGSTPAYLDETAIKLLQEGRETFRRLGLDHSEIVVHEDRLLVMPWVGERPLNALSLSLVAADLEPTPLGIGLELRSEAAGSLRTALDAIGRNDPDPMALARLVVEKGRDKFDSALDEELLCRMYASERLDAARLPGLANTLLGRWSIK